MKNRQYPWILFIILFLADRITKWLALTNVSAMPYTLYNGLTLSVTRNRGVSWSMFATNQTLGFVIVSCVVALISLFFAWYTYQQARQGQPIYFETIVLAGALSNLVDRFVHGGVIDFIDVYVGCYHWPSFNIADACIVCGIIGILLRTWKES